MEFVILLLVIVLLIQVSWLAGQVEKLHAAFRVLMERTTPAVPPATDVKQVARKAVEPAGEGPKPAVPVAPPPPVVQPTPPPPIVMPPPIPVAAPVPVSKPITPAGPPDGATPHSAPPMPPAAMPVQPKSPRATTEQLLGGKAASFVGIAALVTGIVMFVGYAIQHQWIGPAARVLLGVASGLVLVVMGHLAQTRGKNIQLLARVLTGGGSSLAYFSVFAAYQMYHLITAAQAAAGLAVSAAAVFGLSTVYSSQAVAMLALVGAHLTPWLAGGDLAHGLFSLAFLAVVNVPCLLLGIRRRWMALVNVAFVLTMVSSVAWFATRQGVEWRDGWQLPLAFCGLYYVQYLVAGWLRAKHTRTDDEVMIDLGRLFIAGLALVCALYWLLDVGGQASHHGIATGILAALHAVTILWARRRQPGVHREMLYLWLFTVALTGLAIGWQFHGVWISLGWIVAGFLLCPLALREGSKALSGCAFGLGLLGAAKAMFFDLTLYQTAPRMLLNARFFVGLAASGFVYVQSLLHRRDKGSGRLEGQDSIPPLAVLMLLFFAVSDVFWTQGARGVMAWMLTSGYLLVAALACSVTGRQDSGLSRFGLFLLPVVTLKVMLLDAPVTWWSYSERCEAVLNSVFWLRMAMILAAGWWTHRVHGRRQRPMSVQLRIFTNLLTISSLLILATAELWRITGGWNQSLITLLWALSALAMVGFGLVRDRRWFRYAGLALIGGTTLKVFFLDLADLSGLPRIGAFIGMGVVLLVLSYAYQRVAPALAALGKPAERGGSSGDAPQRPA